MRLTKSIIIAALAATSLSVQAAPPAEVAGYAFESGDGMVSVLSAPAAEEVWAQARALHGRLEAESKSLQQTAEDGKMSPARLFLAAVMPGGFIYAAFTHQRADEARQRLEAVNDELAELDDDLRYWHERHAGLEVALAD